MKGKCAYMLRFCFFLFKADLSFDHLRQNNFVFN